MYRARRASQLSGDCPTLAISLHRAAAAVARLLTDLRPGHRHRTATWPTQQVVVQAAGRPLVDGKKEAEHYPGAEAALELLALPVASGSNSASTSSDGPVAAVPVAHAMRASRILWGSTPSSHAALRAIPSCRGCRYEWMQLRAGSAAPSRRAAGTVAAGSEPLALPVQPVLPEGLFRARTTGLSLAIATENEKCDAIELRGGGWGNCTRLLPAGDNTFELSAADTGGGRARMLLPEKFSVDIDTAAAGGGGGGGVRLARLEGAATIRTGGGDIELDKITSAEIELDSGGGSRRRDCHFAGAPSPSTLIHLLKADGGCSRMTVSSTAQVAGQ